MNELSTLFDSFYSRFILRDLFGKIVPGMMLLWAMAVSLTSSSSILIYIPSVSFWFWSVIFSVAWILAFAVQALAEKFGYIRYYPKEIDKIEYYDMNIKFNKIALKFDLQQVERFIVIKEACGNGYMSLSISILLLVADRILDIYSSDTPFIQEIVGELYSKGLVLILLLGVIYFLREMHFIQVEQDYKYKCQVLKQYGNATASGNSN